MSEQTLKQQNVLCLLRGKKEKDTCWCVTLVGGLVPWFHKKHLERMALLLEAAVEETGTDNRWKEKVWTQNTGLIKNEMQS